MIVLIIFVLFNIIRICEVLMSYVWWFIEFVVMIIIMFIWVLGGWGFGLWVKVFVMLYCY